MAFKEWLPARIFPESKVENAVIDSLMLEAISGKEIEKVLNQANDSLAKKKQLKKSDQYLLAFFKKLQHLETTKEGKIRIGYYGDSMTDGDLIVQDLRLLFQDAFGGTGIGFLPITSESAKSRASVWHTYSNTWRTLCAPFSCPNALSNPCFLAQRPLPSIIMAKCSGYFVISIY